MFTVRDLAGQGSLYMTLKPVRVRVISVSYWERYQGCSSHTLNPQACKEGNCSWSLYMLIVCAHKERVNKFSHEPW